MDKDKKEYMQLPPIEKSVSGDVVKMIWEFLMLSAESQESVEKQIQILNQDREIQSLEIPKEYQKIMREEISSYEEALQSVFVDIMKQATELTCWVYDHKYIQGWNLEQMLQEHPEAKLLITAVSINFDLIKG